uniref:Uncharacterized protein n=1 Tax=Oryza brachyantha TaxID=4533 RepID=J3LVN2_ORYBR
GKPPIRQLFSGRPPSPLPCRRTPLPFPCRPPQLPPAATVRFARWVVEPNQTKSPTLFVVVVFFFHLIDSVSTQESVSACCRSTPASSAFSGFSKRSRRTSRIVGSCRLRHGSARRWPPNADLSWLDPWPRREERACGAGLVGGVRACPF